MYNRKRIARGAGTAIAAWALIGLLVVSTGVAYAVPLAGVGGFFVQTASGGTAEQAVVYPGVADTAGYEGSTVPGDDAGTYPAAIVELRDGTLEDLFIVKTIQGGSDVPSQVLPGNMQIRVYAPEASSSLLLVKSTVIESNSITFNDFEVKDQPGDGPGDRYQAWANETSSLGPSNIRAHFVVANDIRVEQLSITVCWDPNPGDAQAGDEFEYGDCRYIDDP